jgi:hypothetical protein
MEDEFRSILEEFVEDINMTGGVVKVTSSTYGLYEDPSWTDLGATYLMACRALGCTPVISDNDD